MSMTYQDLLDKLRQLDEVTLAEKLQLHSDELVDRFPDRIEELVDDLFDYFEEESDSEDS